jgi:hypothetical protein
MMAARFLVIFGVTIVSLLFLSTKISRESALLDSDTTWQGLSTAPNQFPVAYKDLPRALRPINPGNLPVSKPSDKALTGIRAPYSDNLRANRRLVGSRGFYRGPAAKVEGTIRRAYGGIRAPLPPYEPKHAVPPTIYYRDRFVHAIPLFRRPHRAPLAIHLPDQNIANVVPCTSGCDMVQSRLLKAAEGLVEIAKQTHDARAKAQAAQVFIHYYI